jgi:hypothetical protein
MLREWVRNACFLLPTHNFDLTKGRFMYCRIIDSNAVISVMDCIWISGKRILRRKQIYCHSFETALVYVGMYVRT